MGRLILAWMCTGRSISKPFHRHRCQLVKCLGIGGIAWNYCMIFLNILCAFFACVTSLTCICCRWGALCAEREVNSLLTVARLDDGCHSDPSAAVYDCAPCLSSANTSVTTAWRHHLRHHLHQPPASREHLQWSAYDIIGFFQWVKWWYAVY